MPNNQHLQPWIMPGDAMLWGYQYNSYVLPSLAPLLLLVLLGIHCFRNRKVPGAVPFIVLIGLTILWIITNSLGLSATEDTGRIFWFKFEKALVLPIASAALCFVLAYAGLIKWLTRRVIGVLILVPLAFALLILTNGTHHLVWKHIVSDGIIRTEMGTAHWVAVVYGYALGMAQLAVLIWLFVRSPRHRWIAARLILGLVLMRAASYFNISDNNPFKPLNLMIAASNLTFLLYALAFFRMHLFELVPIARNMVIDRMMEAMIVLDTQKHISDINETAERLLNLSRKKAIGRQAESVLEAFPDLVSLIRNPEEKQKELSLGSPRARWYHLSISPLSDRHSFLLGYLIWIQDITEQKQIQEQHLDNQRTLAMLQERELLGRELHDGIGQILAAAQLQIASASELLSRRETHQAALVLRRLSNTVQEAKDAVRTYLAGVKSISPSGVGFLEVLKNNLDRYSRNHDIRIQLDSAPEVQDINVDSAVAAQLHPIIQEALSNVRRHAKASLAKVFLSAKDGHLCITIEDDGQGFDTTAVGKHDAFGLRSMRGRATSAGGRFEIASVPGKGTRVSVQTPWRKETT